MPVQPYFCRPAGNAMVRRFKVYFADITGRAEPHLYEWAASGLLQADVVLKLAQLKLGGVGFVVSFPHITKVYRFNKTNVDVRAFRTPDMSELSLDRGEGFVEFACLGESIIAHAEFMAWADATNVDDWFAQWQDWQPAGFAVPDKLVG